MPPQGSSTKDTPSENEREAIRKLGDRSKSVAMPVIPGDNDKEIKEQLAQGKSEADAKKNGLASQEHHQANPGPVIAENLGEPASKEELKKRSEELNKKE
ncbi:hypothetical protein BST61_g4956 [Cercospora zeina]